MLTIAICDDKKEIRESLESKVHACVSAKTEQFENGEALLAAGRIFDIVLLDICMSEKPSKLMTTGPEDSEWNAEKVCMNGIATAKKIRQLHQHTVIIFITALQEYVFDAFDVGAFHYLLKPIDDKKFEEVMEKAVLQIKQKKSKEPLLIKSEGTYHNIPIDTILYAENEARKIVLHTTKGNFSFYEKMDVLEEKLGSAFFRSHRGFLVHLQEVAGYDTTGITLKNGETVYLSKQRYPAFVSAYMEYLTR